MFFWSVKSFRRLHIFVYKIGQNIGQNLRRKENTIHLSAWDTRPNDGLRKYKLWCIGLGDVYDVQSCPPGSLCMSYHGLAG